MGSEPGSSDSGTAPAGPPCARDLLLHKGPLEGGRWLRWQQDSSRDYNTGLGAWESWDEVFSRASLHTASVSPCKKTVGEERTAPCVQSEVTPSGGTAATVASQKSIPDQSLDLTSN